MTPTGVPYRAALWHALRGPLLLTLLGLLMATQQAGGAPFSRTWPVLVIAFGVLWLLERLALKAGGLS